MLNLLCECLQTSNPPPDGAGQALTGSRYGHLDRDALIELLERRDAEQKFGLIWESGGPEEGPSRSPDWILTVT